MAQNIIDTDVLVVGGGGAGFRAAIGAREEGAKVLLLSKGPLARCGASPMAGADYTLDGRSLKELGHNGDPNDTPEKVFKDIVTQGFFLNNQRLVEQYVRAAPACCRELIDWGITIGFSEERAIFTSGIGIMDALARKAKSLGVVMRDDTMVLDLCVRDGAITGGLGLDIRTGEFIHFRCRAAVMATGGWHKAFWPNTGMRDLSGEGMAAAHRAGADLGNLEFITFSCNVIYEPPIWRGSIAPYVLGLLAGHRLTNSLGEAFLDAYDPYIVKVGSGTEWNKSFISQACMKEVRAGRGFPGGSIHFSRGDIPWEQVEMWASLIFPRWKYKAVDLSEWGRMLKENLPLKVGPAVEYFDGGIVVNERFETALAGLYAAGECTLGAFGSNRVFSAITEMLVQGAAAGRNAAEYAAGTAMSAADAKVFCALEEEAAAPLSRRDGVRPAQVRRKVQEMAHAHLGPIRSGDELLSFIGFLEEIEKDTLPRLAVSSPYRAYNKEWIDAIELGNMVHLLHASALSALFRRESRGVHYREDYPDTDNDHWLQESIVSSGGLEVSARPVTVTILAPPGGKLPYLEMMKKMMEAHSETGGHH